MEFLDLPKEVIDSGLLPFLKWNDLLRFRRVCHATRDIVTAYLRVHPELAPELEINEEDKSFEAFMEMGIPTSKLFLNNNQTADEFYSKNKEVLSEFLEEYGPAIKSLRVYELSMFICGEEWDFLEGLKNLKTLEAERYGLGENSVPFGAVGSGFAERKLEKAKSDPRSAERERQQKCALPNTFKQLQVVKIGRLNDKDCLVVIEDCNIGLLRIAQSLEYFSLPFQERPYMPSVDDGLKDRLEIVPQLPQDTSFSMLWSFIMVYEYIDNETFSPSLPDKSGPRKFNLKVVDFANWTSVENFHTVAVASRTFLETCQICVEKNVRLENVHPFWFLGRMNPDLGSPQLGHPILSLVDIQPFVWPMEMPNLEKIEIRSTYESTVGNNWRQERPDWPALKVLDISVDSKTGNPDPWLAPEGSEGSRLWLDTKQIFHFFFQDVVRPNLIELRLNFVKEAGEVAVPKAREIVASCPNLKKLTIVNWPGMNKDLLELFRGLPGLEELSFENCKNLGNVAFVGLDTRDPQFFKLKKLRKLSLKGLDQMPKITDLLFSMVLRHLDLTHFTLTSSSPVKSVTVAGIQALLEGSFGRSIEKFPFQNWSLDGIPTEEFKQLEKQFKSYYML